MTNTATSSIKLELPELMERIESGAMSHFSDADIADEVEAARITDARNIFSHLAACVPNNSGTDYEAWETAKRLYPDQYAAAAKPLPASFVDNWTF